MTATETSVRPIPFSGPMVCAILAGRKTQTRRVVKPVRGFEYNDVCRPDMAHDPWAVWWHGEYETVGCLQQCPYGKPGDQLWVRELLRRPDGDPWLYAADQQPVVVAKADETAMLVWAHHKEQDYCTSIFMPRWASRITLEIEDVRVQRVQEISAADARAEGMESCTPGDQYRVLWDVINAKRGYGWATNPYVWCISFRRIT